MGNPIVPFTERKDWKITFMRKINIRHILEVVIISVMLLVPVSCNAQVIHNAPDQSSFKTFMSYKAIKNRTTKQYELQQDCTTSPEGLRTYNGYYAVALGTGFNAEVGDYVDVELSSGNTLHCVVGDIKQDCHTDKTNKQVEQNGNVVEFIVDTKKLDPDVKKTGDISNVSEQFQGDVENIVVYEEEDKKPLEN